MEDAAGHDLDPGTWEHVQGLVPIPCVDVLPYVDGGRSRRLLLIEREVPDGAGGWQRGLALVGGRIRRGETLTGAASRHLDGTVVGPEWTPLRLGHPPVVAEYFPDARAGFPFDPRRHAVALTYLLHLPAAPPRVAAAGEATRVVWREEGELSRREVGFRQWMVVEQLLGRRLRD